MDSCSKHTYQVGIALCRRCGHAWCRSCLVYAFGPKKPPYCLSCAMVAGGVRTSGSLPAMPKAQRRALKAQAKAEAKAAVGTATPPHAPTDDVQVSLVTDREPAEAFRRTDWSTARWEDRQPAMTG